jgi:hypothetical protein
MPTGKTARFLLVAEIASIACCCCLHLAEVYPPWYRSIDHCIDSSLKWHLITFPSLEGTAASTRTCLQLEYDDYTNPIKLKKNEFMLNCLNHLQSSIDLSTDPGLKSHLITIPSSEEIAASTRI